MIDCSMDGWMDGSVMAKVSSSMPFLVLNPIRVIDCLVICLIEEMIATYLPFHLTLSSLSLPLRGRKTPSQAKMVVSPRVKGGGSEAYM